MEQIAKSWDVFIDNFFTGSGGMVLRGTGGYSGFGDLFWVAFGADLGYWVWFKFFGLWGIVYLFALVIGFYFYALRCAQLGDAAHVGRFAMYHFVCILISLLTIDYLTRPDGIILMCLTWALIVKAAQSAAVDSESEQDILVSARANKAPAPGGR